MNMLTKVGLLATSLLLLGGCAASAPNTAADEAKLKAVDQSWFETYAKGDAAGVANLYAQDAIVMPPNAGALSGRAAIQAYLVTGIANTKKANLSIKGGPFTGVGVSGDSGWLSGTWLLTDASGAKIDTGSYLEVFHRTQTGWTMTRDIWNSDRPLPDTVAPAATMPAPKTG
jgi:ketosteroid isomerase-like protein